ncbi:vitamin K epoxide reductase family protein [Aquimarina sp. 2201CG5-10]|uniref:vitamin K epoxide reductase family protein n=1 Tax=Aquimarina callyspongiae TaxID=3098150 RepID=UPI002AB45479|nr:vitamin K epoxide reductase family protein [Aquimarina sp. 2201CG5-10]MDY8136809.1 vitamin K epoxide reductase family protein [Aquimarina sp. 2201CG5-10]
MKNSIEKIVEHVLIQNQISNYDKKDLELQLQIHPNYPSFQSITDTLDYFTIDNIAVEVPVEALDQLPKSFVSLIKSDNGDEIVSIIRKKDIIQLKHSSLKKKNFSYDEFKEIWVPKVIAVEESTKSGILSNQSLLQNILIVGLLAGLIATFAVRAWDLNQIIFLVLSLTGLVFSFFAVRESLGIQSQTMHQFCTSVGNTNCGDVINNNSGKIFKNFSLADAGMVFFGSLFLYQLFYGFNNALLIPSLIGIPFIIYSLYSQAFVIKKWCAVCLVMSAISIGLAVMAVISFPIGIANISLIAALVIIATLFTLAYTFIKEKMVENKTFKAENVKLNHFKRDTDIFNHLLSTSEKIEGDVIIDNEIVLGNPNSGFKIVSLTNPMCGYCKGAFEAYSRILNTMSDHIQVVIRLRVNLENLEDNATQISLRLMEIYRDQGQQNFITAYSEWFADRTPTKWIKKYGNPGNDAALIEVLKKQSEWADSNNLYYTPATLINNIVYPKKYNYDEFFHFTSVMVENYNENHSPEMQQTVEV